MKYKNNVKMARLILGIFVILFVNLEVNGQLPIDISKVFSIIKWCDKVFMEASSYEFGIKTLMSETSHEFEEILREVKKVSHELEAISMIINKKLDSVLSILANNLRDNIYLQLGKMKLNDLLNSVDRFYNRAMDLNFRGNFTSTILKKFIELTLWDADSLPTTLEKIYQIIIPKHQIVPPIIQLMGKDAQDNLKYDCNKYISAQQRMYYIFVQVILAQMKGLATTTYAYKIQQVMDRSYNYSIDINNAKKLFRKRMPEYYMHMIEGMQSFPLEIHRCDVNPSKRDIDFVELYRFSRRVFIKTFGINCTRCENFNGAFTNYLGAFGTLYDCDLSPDKMSSVCLATSNSLREIMWWVDDERPYYFHSTHQSPNRVTYGHRTECENVMLLDSYLYKLFGNPRIASCSPCPCSLDLHADENGMHGAPVRAYISIAPQISDISKNMIVTGVKFINENQTIYLQMQQTKLLSNGMIAGHSIWKMPDNVHQVPESSIQNNGLQYAAFDHEWKNFDLDDIMLPDNYVVTGLQFERENVTKSFRLKIHGTPFNFNTGLLNSSGSRWFSCCDETKSNRPLREEIQLIKPDDPTRCQNYDYDLETHKSIRFMHTDKFKDAGQNTVPFFDAQRVDTQPAFPLSGIGLFYRAKDGFGGYIAPRIYTINVYEYLKYEWDKFQNNSTSRIHN